AQSALLGSTRLLLVSNQHAHALPSHDLRRLRNLQLGKKVPGRQRSGLRVSGLWLLFKFLEEERRTEIAALLQLGRPVWTHHRRARAGAPAASRLGSARWTWHKRRRRWRSSSPAQARNARGSSRLRSKPQAGRPLPSERRLRPLPKRVQRCVERPPALVWQASPPPGFLVAPSARSPSLFTGKPPAENAFALPTKI
ncbi:Hypothetical predicted protein, partial [Podarcis lilfordi]